jgi:hypothetical protein
VVSRSLALCPPRTEFSKMISSTGTEIVSETNLVFVFSFMSSVPPGLSPLRLPRGEIVFYPTGCPSIRMLTCEIAALGYEVSGFPLHHTNLRPLPPGVWHCAVVLGDIILFIVDPTEPSLSDLSSLQSGYGSSSHNEPDSDNVNPDFLEDGYWRR